jgi:hypothetical protein
VFWHYLRIIWPNFLRVSERSQGCWGGFDPSSIAELEANFSVINEVTSGRTALGESFIDG